MRILIGCVGAGCTGVTTEVGDAMGKVGADGLSMHPPSKTVAATVIIKTATTLDMFAH